MSFSFGKLFVFSCLKAKQTKLYKVKSKSSVNPAIYSATGDILTNNDNYVHYNQATLELTERVALIIVIICYD